MAQAAKIELEEPLFENVDEALNEIDVLTENWKNRLSVNNTRFVERYLKCEMGIGFEVGLKEDCSKKFVAVFERKGRLRLVDGAGRILPIDKKLNLTKRATGGNDAPMLVDNVELTQLPERVPLPSTVRLQSTDDFFGSGADALEEGGLLRRGEPGRIPTYWEIGVLQNAGVGYTGANYECCRETVERAPKIVDDIANNAAPCPWQGLLDSDPVNFDCGFRVFIHNDFVRVAPNIGFDLRYKFLKVFLGPTDLYPATEQRIVCHGA